MGNHRLGNVTYGARKLRDQPTYGHWIRRLSGGWRAAAYTSVEPVSSNRVGIHAQNHSIELLEIVKKLLSESGYKVDTREHALGTAQWVAREQPEFVLLGVKMPALSGGELTQLIRRKQAMSQVAVILHSSMDSQELDALAESTGALGAIKKTPNLKLFFGRI